MSNERAPHVVPTGLLALTLVGSACLSALTPHGYPGASWVELLWGMRWLSMYFFGWVAWQAPREGRLALVPWLGMVLLYSLPQALWSGGPWIGMVTILNAGAPVVLLGLLAMAQRDPIAAVLIGLAAVSAWMQVRGMAPSFVAVLLQALVAGRLATARPSIGGALDGRGVATQWVVGAFGLVAFSSIVGLTMSAFGASRALLQVASVGPSAFLVAEVANLMMAVATVVLARRTQQSLLWIAAAWMGWNTLASLGVALFPLLALTLLAAPLAWGLWVFAMWSLSVRLEAVTARSAWERVGGLGAVMVGALLLSGVIGDPSFALALVTVAALCAAAVARDASRALSVVEAELDEPGALLFDGAPT